MHFRNSSNFKISEPIDVIERLNTVIAAGVEGQCLNDLLRWTRIIPPTQGKLWALSKQLERAAAWLRFLHSIPVEDIPLDRQDFICKYEGFIAEARASRILRERVYLAELERILHGSGSTPNIRLGRIIHKFPKIGRWLLMKFYSYRRGV